MAVTCFKSVCRRCWRPCDRWPKPRSNRVDNGSRDDSVEFCAKCSPRSEWFLGSGITDFLHRGKMWELVRQRTTLWVLLTNDMFVDPGFYDLCSMAFARPRAVFAVSSQIFFQDRERRAKRTGDWWRVAPRHTRVVSRRSHCG